MSNGNPVRIGIIGAGFARTTQIPGFRDCMGARIVAIASRNPERAAAVAKEFEIEHVANDWRELVATVNMLDAEHHYTSERVAAAEAVLAIPAMLCYALAAQFDRRTGKPD